MYPLYAKYRGETWRGHHLVLKFIALREAIIVESDIASQPVGDRSIMWTPHNNEKIWEDVTDQYTPDGEE